METVLTYLADRIEGTENIEVITNAEIREFLGDGTLEGMVVEDNRTGERRTLEARALFVFIGAEANTDWLKDTLKLDDQGFILTGRALDRSILEDRVWPEFSRDPYLLEASLPGIFAVGDVRSGSVKRMASAVGEGSMAVRYVHQCLAETSTPS